MKEILHLKMIIEKLAIREVSIVKDNLYIENHSSLQSKVGIKLFNYLLTNSDIEVSQVSYNLYGRVNKIALRKLSQRLTERILDILISKENLINNDLFDSRGLEVFNIRRKLLYYDVLAAHGVTQYALIVLNQVISLSKKIEAYDYLIIALEKKLIKMSLRFGAANYNIVFDEIKFYTDCNYFLKESMYLLRLYSSNYEYQQKVLLNSDLKRAIDRIKLNYIRTNSKCIKINLSYLESIYYFDCSDYIKCRIVFSSLYSFLKLNSNFVFRSYLVTCLINMAEIETMLWNFDLSLKSLYKVINQYERNEFNDKLIKEMIFINYYYSGELYKAEAIIKGIVSINDSNTTFIGSKRRFYLASLLTINGEYYESNKLVSTCQLLDKDKEGWNIGVRLLTIINGIELEKYLLVESQIENLRKHISRVNGKSVFFNRSVLITKILISLSKSSFDFNRTLILCGKLIEKIGGLESKLMWQIKSPEMIIFHEWFTSKVENKPYDHVEVMKRLKKKNKNQ